MSGIRTWNERKTLLVLIVCGLLDGLIYMTIEPPWQHYDEPGNFEHAWLIANWGRNPGRNEYDQTMRREVAESMVEHGFFRDLNFLPNLEEDTSPIWIGLSQNSDPVLYYAIISIPLRFFKGFSVTTQLYVARGISLLFYLFTLLAVWGTARELFPANHVMRWFLPGSLILLPGFADLMTAVNNDVAAVAFFSFFLWGSIRLLRTEISRVNLVWVISTGLLCILTKPTVVIAFPLMGVVFIFALLRGKNRKYAWVILGISIICAIIAVFSYGDAAHWVRQVDQNLPTRTTRKDAVHGRAVFQVEARSQVVQILPPATVSEMEDNEITLGIWLWSEQPLRIYLPQLGFSDGSMTPPVKVTLSQTPTFFSWTTAVPNEIDRAWIFLAPHGPQDMAHSMVYMDEVVLTLGSFSAEEPLLSDDKDAMQGTWDGTPITNLVRNGSAETGAPRFRAWFQTLAHRLGIVEPMYFFWESLDWQATGSYLRVSTRHIFRTFWAKFSWGNVSLIGAKPYRVVFLFAILGILGAVVAFIRNFRKLPVDILFIFGSATCFISVFGIINRLDSLIKIPVHPTGRYIYPAIIPIWLVFTSGWLEVADWIPIHRARKKAVAAWLWMAILLILNLVSILSIILFYRRT